MHRGSANQWLAIKTEAIARAHCQGSLLATPVITMLRPELLRYNRRRMRLETQYEQSKVGVSPEARNQFRALVSFCGIYKLDRTHIRLTGADRVRWLNGMVTNNIRDLAIDHGVYAFLLNPQGRILADLYAYNRGDSVVVDTDQSQLQKVLATFDHYIIMDDVEVKDVTQELTSIGVAGPKAIETLEAAGFTSPDLSELETLASAWKGIACTLLRTVEDHEQSPAFEIWITPDSVRQLWDALISTGAKPVGSEAL